MFAFYFINERIRLAQQGPLWFRKQKAETPTHSAKTLGGRPKPRELTGFPIRQGKFLALEKMPR